MNGSRAAKRRSAGIASAKVLITSASMAATLGGWAAIGAGADPATGLARTTPGDGQPRADTAAPAQPQAPLDQRQPADGTSPWPQGSFGDRRRHHGEWAPNGGFGDQPAVPSDQAGPSAPDTPNANPAPAPAQPQPRARTRSSR